jgi:hypothetical protein
LSLFKVFLVNQLNTYISIIYRAILGGVSDCLNTTSGKRSGVDHDHKLGISSMKMKKMKGRKKVREPRFCFKTLSTDVDVLDDGYKWRKYGQKVVKNTQHPRYNITIYNSKVLSFCFILIAIISTLINISFQFLM